MLSTVDGVREPQGSLVRRQVRQPRIVRHLAIGVAVADSTTYGVQTMNTPDEEVPSAPISAHCIKRWPHADQAPGILGRHIADTIEAIYGASALTLVLQNDLHIRDEREETDKPDENLAPFDTSTRAGLFSALHTCLNTAHDKIDRMYRMARSNPEADRL